MPQREPSIWTFLLCFWWENDSHVNFCGFFKLLMGLNFAAKTYVKNWDLNAHCADQTNDYPQYSPPQFRQLSTKKVYVWTALKKIPLRMQSRNWALIVDCYLYLYKFLSLGVQKCEFSVGQKINLFSDLLKYTIWTRLHICIPWGI